MNSTAALATSSASEQAPGGQLKFTRCRPRHHSRTDRGEQSILGQRLRVAGRQFRQAVTDLTAQAWPPRDIKGLLERGEVIDTDCHGGGLGPPNSPLTRHLTSGHQLHTAQKGLTAGGRASGDKAGPGSGGPDLLPSAVVS